MKLIAIAAMMLALAPAMAQEQAPAMNWQDAIGELAAERTRAETCVSLLKRHAGDDEAALDQGRAAYDMARAEIDGVIAALSVALAKGEEPESFTALESAAEARGAGTRGLLQDRAGPGAAAERDARSAIFAVLGEAIGPLIEAAKEIYIHVSDQDVLVRETIRTQLEATQMAELRQRRGLSGLAAFALAALAVLLPAATSHAQEASPGPLRAAGAGARPGRAHGADQARRRRRGRAARGDRVATTRRCGSGRWRTAGCCAPSACRPGRAMSARSMPWRSARTAR